ncbi:UspA domain-containing protein [Balamuthia mandrillaris]
MNTAAAEEEKRFKRKVILIAVDESEEAVAAAKRGFSLAREDDVLHLVFVVVTKETAKEGSPEESERLKAARYEAKLQIKRLQELAAELRLAHLVDTHIVEAEDPREELCRLAEELRAHLVVMGRRGRGSAVRGALRTLVGSTSDFVLKHAPCSVMVASK